MGVCHSCYSCCSSAQNLSLEALFPCCYTSVNWPRQIRTLQTSSGGDYDSPLSFRISDTNASWIKSHIEISLICTFGQLQLKKWNSLTVLKIFKLEEVCLKMVWATWNIDNLNKIKYFHKKIVGFGIEFCSVCEFRWGIFQSRPHYPEAWMPLMFPVSMPALDCWKCSVEGQDLTGIVWELKRRDRIRPIMVARLWVW